MTDAPEAVDSPEPAFRLAYVPGATPAKWARIWRERMPDAYLELLSVPAAEAPGLLRAGGADAGLVRLPVEKPYFSAIPLYTETSVVVVPKDHVITAAEEVVLADLAEEVVFLPLDDVLGWSEAELPGTPGFQRPETTVDAIELVAANVGVLVVPQSLARLYHRRDVTYRTVTDAPQSRVALAWPEERTTDAVEDFIGIVRGRTVNSSRGRRTEEGRDAGKETKEAKGARGGAKGAKPAAGGRRQGQGGQAGQGGRRAGGASGRAGGGRSGQGGKNTGRGRRRG
ncbi:LysR family substrate-binding domain-containing protein [Streptomyces sp. BI20]|uniref:LysR family substrate-binding domain-containing protein n=1 Tax=Streptomyces sp. BI20 TaxID=3403460 RepID=UPI003C741898